jgi:hypothetical protein
MCYPLLSLDQLARAKRLSETPAEREFAASRQNPLNAALDLIKRVVCFIAAIVCLGKRSANTVGKWGRWRAMPIWRGD